MKSIPNETITRITKAIRYIETHLHQKLVLETVAKEAHFSPYHFHRIFSIVTGETLQNFINRKRIEKSAIHLINQKEITITEVAEKVGFSNLSSFSRAFKKFYGISPIEFQKQSPKKYSKICKTESKNGQVTINLQQYICNIQNALNFIQMNANTTVKVIEKLELAYVSSKGKMEDVGEAYNKLMAWAHPKGLINDATRMITMYHDSPKITDADKIGMSACLILESPIKTSGIVNFKTLEAQKCIVSRFEITFTEFQQAWESSFVWMTENGYKKADKDPFEIFYNNPNEHPQKKAIVDICIPVE